MSNVIFSAQVLLTEPSKTNALLRSHAIFHLKSGNNSPCVPFMPCSNTFHQSEDSPTVYFSVMLISGFTLTSIKIVLLYGCISRLQMVVFFANPSDAGSIRTKVLERV